MRACFWVEAGPLVGAGHVVRADALADALSDHGWTSTLHAADDAAALCVASGRHQVEVLHGDSFAQVCGRVKPQLAIVDLPHTHPAAPGVLRQVACSGARRVSFDGSDPGASESELVVNAVAHTKDLLPAPDGAVLLLGPRYAVLRREVTRARQLRRSPGGRRARLVVGFGAADPAGLTPRVLRALAPVEAHLRVDVLLGPLFHPETTARSERAAKALSESKLHRAVTDPTALLAAADLGVFCFGNLFLEAAATGLPTLLWHPSPEHAAVARRFAAQLADPLGVDLGEARLDPPEILTATVAALLGDGLRRRAYSSAALAALDGLGAQRVARAALAIAGG